jgi:hypothetical protein
LVQIRNGLPTPPAQQDPPSTDPPANGGIDNSSIGLILLLILQRLFSVFRF